jgi:hypothetical protein
VIFFYLNLYLAKLAFNRSEARDFDAQERIFPILKLTTLQLCQVTLGTSRSTSDLRRGLFFDIQTFFDYYCGVMQTACIVY